MIKRHRSLSRNLSLGILLLVVPTFVLALGILFFQSRHLIRQKTTTNFNTIVTTAVQQVKSYTGMVETVTNANAWLLEEQNDTVSLQAIAKRIASLNPNISGCTVSSQPNHLNKTVFETGKACWVDTADIVSYCRPLRTSEGRLMGVVAVDLTLSRLAEAVNSIEQPYPYAYFILISSDGRYLIHPDTASILRKTIFSDHDANLRPDMIALGYQMTAGKQGTMHIDIDGKECHVSYAPVEGTDWSLAMIGPEDEVMANYQHLVYVIVALIFIGLVLGFWLCNRAVKRIISPINALLDMTQRITNGHYDEVIPHSVREDEIGQLQNSFATMQRSLNNHLENIHDATDALRQRNEYRAQDVETTRLNIEKKISFIQSVLHQIRTPLSIITGFTDMLRNSIAAQRAGDREHVISTDYLNEIKASMKHNAIHLKRMVLMLFDSAETEVSSATGFLYNRSDEIPCNSLAQKCIDHTQSHFPGAKITFDTELPDTTYILTNHLFLFRTIRELLSNAVKFSDGKHIRLRVTETETTVRYIIEDEGPGLAEEALDLTLKPLVEMDDQLESSGLGLPMAYRHAKGLGGTLIHDSDYKNGCRFILEIPK
jgi:signal transduction histidine kinase